MLDMKTSDTTIQKILKMAKRLDVFWDRWIAHGIEPEHIKKLREKDLTLDAWLAFWPVYGSSIEKQAEMFERKSDFVEAEKNYRKAAMYFYMNYWIHYKNGTEKKDAYLKCLELYHHADQLSRYITFYETISFDNFVCRGRVRKSCDYKGVVILVNPVDSTKEELYQYEADFLKDGFATVSFDGPGQGENFTFSDVIGTNERWKTFINGMIDFTRSMFPDEKIFLFGTSLGAAWALYGSSHHEVTKIAAVSPTSQYERMSLPSYFIERIEASFINNKLERPVPDVFELEYKTPVYLFYGEQDLMVKKEDIQKVFNLLPDGKKITYYKEEGHCCNHRLEEIRMRCTRWFLE